MFCSRFVEIKNPKEQSFSFVNICTMILYINKKVTTRKTLAKSKRRGFFTHCKCRHSMVAIWRPIDASPSLASGVSLTIETKARMLSCFILVQLFNREYITNKYIFILLLVRNWDTLALFFSVQVLVVLMQSMSWPVFLGN